MKNNATIKNNSPRQEAVLTKPLHSPIIEQEEMAVKIPMIPLFTLQETDNENLFRVVNRESDWTHYYHKPTKRYLPAVNHIIHAGFPKGEGFYQYLLNTTKDEAKKTLESAGERGSRVHEAIRQMIDGVEIAIDRKFKNDLTGKYEDLTIDEWSCLQAWVAWVKEYKPQVMAVETSIFNLKTGYAGTIDFIGTIEIKGKKTLALLDWKTSGGIWDDYKLQTAAYAHALKKLPAVTGVVRLGTKHKIGYEMKVWDKAETKEHYKKFLSAFDIYSMNHKDYVFSDEVIPAVLSVSIPRYVEKIINKGQ